MAKKDAYYFPHDSNARNDERILCLRADFGCEGYGIYWILIEMMHESADSSLSHKMIKGHAMQMQVQEGLLQSLISQAIELNLFATDTEKYWSERVKKNKQEREVKYTNLSNVRSEAGKKGLEIRWKNSKRIANDSKTDFANSKHIAKHSQRKGKERKEKEEFTPPTIEEVKEYFKGSGYAEQAGERAFNYYSSSGWKDSKGNQVKNWKQKMIAVWFKDESRINTTSNSRVGNNSFI